MGKTVTTLLLAICSIISNAQFGPKVAGPVTWEGVTMTEGDTLHFGRGTLANGQFRFLFNNHGDHLDGSNFTLLIRKFSIWQSEKFGERHYILFSYPINGAHISDLTGAIDSGEVLAINSHKLQSKKPTSIVVDELIKLKQLLDNGSLTQQEFNDQKKKLLNQ